MPLFVCVYYLILLFHLILSEFLYVLEIPLQTRIL